MERRAYSNIEIFDRYFVSSIVLDLLKVYKNIDRVELFNLKELLDIRERSPKIGLNKVNKYKAFLNWLELGNWFKGE